MFDILMAIKYINITNIYTKQCAIIWVVMAINLIQEQVWSLKYH